MDSLKGVFIGLATADIAYLVASSPGPDQKIVAKKTDFCAGGPAANAAVAFCALGGVAELATLLGRHALGFAVRQELEEQHVVVHDLAPDFTDVPPIAIVMVTEETGQRAVISGRPTTPMRSSVQPAHLRFPDASVFLTDGHQLEVALDICCAAKERSLPVVLDGGSWKPGLERLLPFVEVAICSENFLPPGALEEGEVIRSLMERGIPNIAISKGGFPITYVTQSGDSGVIPVPRTTVVDTLGAGDILHGSFCYFYAKYLKDFTRALSAAIQIASLSCESWGTRNWMSEVEKIAAIVRKS